MLSVWDWAKETKTVDAKVRKPFSPHFLGLPLWDWPDLSINEPRIR